LLQLLFTLVHNHLLTVTQKDFARLRITVIKQSISTEEPSFISDQGICYLKGIQKVHHCVYKSLTWTSSPLPSHTVSSFQWGDMLTEDSETDHYIKLTIIHCLLTAFYLRH
jgi:hypothetical protein